MFVSVEYAHSKLRTCSDVASRTPDAPSRPAGVVGRVGPVSQRQPAYDGRLFGKMYFVGSKLYANKPDVSVELAVMKCLVVFRST